ncbi:MAG: protein kinase [Rhizobiales bacterium]|nr:protein kinase [Hyphomicrobiales bacterium]
MAEQTAVIFGRVPPGTRLNDTYEIDTLIAAGGMGEVYRGHLIETGDQVAIKLIRPELIGNEAALALFRKEASALHHLHHEAIIRYFVFAIDPALRRPYLAMEFVDGEPLSELVKRGPLAVGQCLVLLRRLAAGLAAAHEIGIIHRDMSADNVILPGGDLRRAKIIDFGIAKSTLSGATTVIGDGFAGKYNYVSPEQLGLFGGTITPKSDMYSLGLLIAEALRGRPIDMGRSHVETIESRRKVPDLDGVDAALVPLLTAMLQPLPDDRPASMEAIRDWQPVPEASGEQGLSTGAPGARRRGRLRAAEDELHAAPRRRRWLPAAIVAATLTAVGAAGLAVVTWAPALIPGQAPVARDDDPFPPLTEANRPRERDDGQSPLLTPSPREAARVGPASAPAADQGDQAAQDPAAQNPAATAPAEPGAAEPSLADALAALLRRPPEAAEGRPAAPARAEPARIDPVVPPTVAPAPARPSPPVPGPEAATSGDGLSVRPAEPSLAALPPVSPIPARPAPVQPAPMPPPPARLPAPATPADFVRAYDGGPCLFLAIRSAGDRRADIEAFGISADAVRRFDADFKRGLGFEANIQFRPLSEAQCPAVDFLRSVTGDRDAALRFDLQAFNVRAGQSIEGSIQGAGLKSVSVLVVTDDGAVQRASVRSQPGGRPSSVSIATEPGAAHQRRPKLVLAIVAPQRPQALDFPGQASAATLFPALQRELAGNPQPVTVLRQYFRIEN